MLNLYLYILHFINFLFHSVTLLVTPIMKERKALRSYLTNPPQLDHQEHNNQ